MKSTVQKNVSFTPDCGTTANGGWWHYYLTKTRHVGHTNEQSIYSVMSILRSEAFELPVTSTTFRGFSVFCIKNVL